MFGGFSAPFIHRPVATTLLMVAIVLVGLVAYPNLPVAPLPQVDFPTISVAASLPGASPETMAASVAQPLERQIAQIPGVTQMTSTSSLGVTGITVQFDLNRNIDAAANDVQAAMTALKQSRAALERDKALEAAADKSVALAIANIGSARAALDLAKIVVDYTTLQAPFDGVILVRQAELGEVVSPGAAIVTLADIDHVWLRAYVNEPDVGKIRLGEAATVTTNSYPGKEYPGRISFISEAAEFTPKSVETHAERVTLVYRIRIDIENPCRTNWSPACRPTPKSLCARPGSHERSAEGRHRGPQPDEAVRRRRRGGAAELDCAKGEVFGFVGPDGAGKTTIMRLLAAVMTPDEGSIAIEGVDVVATPSARARTSATCRNDSGSTKT